MRVPASTLAGIETRGEGRTATWTRRGILVVLLVFVLAGLSGRLGVSTATESASAAGYDLLFPT